MSEYDIARDGGPFNLKEALVALEFHAVKAAKRGDYGAHSDLSKIAEFIESIYVERAEETRAMVRAIRASVESLS